MGAQPSIWKYRTPNYLYYAASNCGGGYCSYGAADYLVTYTDCPEVSGPVQTLDTSCHNSSGYDCPSNDPPISLSWSKGWDHAPAEVTNNCY